MCLLSSNVGDSNFWITWELIQGCHWNFYTENAVFIHHSTQSRIHSPHRTVQNSFITPEPQPVLLQTSQLCTPKTAIFTFLRPAEISWKTGKITESFIVAMRRIDLLLTELRSKLLLEKLTFPQLVKKFPKFYRTRKSITAFTSARHRSLSWARSIHSIPRTTLWKSILILSCHLRLSPPSGSFMSRFSKRLCEPYSCLLLGVCCRL
jgi:hypothetical protein